jgi:hypothetical protein
MSSNQHDDIKKQLEDDSKKIKSEIKTELYQVSDQVEKIGTSALLVGGSAAIGYWLVQRFGPWKAKKFGQRRSRFRRAGESLMQIFIIYLLSVAREKLIAYLESLEEKSPK